MVKQLIPLPFASNLTQVMILNATNPEFLRSTY